MTSSSNTSYDLAGMAKSYRDYNMGNNILVNNQNINDLNNLNNLNYGLNYGNMAESETSSISMSSGKNIIKPKEANYGSSKIFQTRNHLSEKEVLNKKRKRYIKNNKFVYVHPGSAAAKKMEIEKVKKIIKTLISFKIGSSR